MIRIDHTLTPRRLLPKLERFWRLSGEKILRIAAEYDPAAGASVLRGRGRYTSRGWAEWMQGFRFGAVAIRRAGPLFGVLR